MRVQNKGKWDRTGLIVEALSNRQYRVKLNGSGRITLRNHRFLKLESLNTVDEMVNPDSGSSSGSPNLVSDPPAVPIVPQQDQASSPLSAPEPGPSSPSPASSISPPSLPVKLPRALKELHNYNSKGLKEGLTSGSRLRSGKDPSA